MQLFESVLTLAAVAILLLQVSRKLNVPYPTMLAAAGVVVAALPWSPQIRIDPQLALALFIAPALLVAAFDLPPRQMRRHWSALVALAGAATVITAVVVAWVAQALVGMPWAAALALGAIVAPPDAAAATAVLSRFDLPRRTVTVLEGEGLLNDAVALLLYSAAVAAATSSDGLMSVAPQLALAVPGGVLLGVLLGKAYLRIAPLLDGTLGGKVFEFIATFAAWIIATRLQLSAILCVVAYAVVISRGLPAVHSARDRQHSFAVWETTVFLLNVLAFLLMGLQARDVVTRLGWDLWPALGFALAVLGVVIAVRITWVLLYNRAEHAVARWRGRGKPPSLRSALLVAWCGMRGLITLAIALALPAQFPARDLIVLSAFVVVLGTLVLQGLTLAPVIRLLRIKPDGSFDRELMFARNALVDAAVASLGDRNDPVSSRIRADYAAQLDRVCEDEDASAPDSSETRRRLRAIAAQRRKLMELRDSGRIDDDVFRTLQQELDWEELAATPRGRLEMVEG
jgi:CPA1 family monovalent cation:H+ antiporter